VAYAWTYTHTDTYTHTNTHIQTRKRIRVPCVERGFSHTISTVSVCNLFAAIFKFLKQYYKFNSYFYALFMQENNVIYCNVIPSINISVHEILWKLINIISLKTIVGKLVLLHIAETCFCPLQHCDRGFESHWGMDVCVCSVCVFSVST
jgi:hypothetical protein